MKKLLLGTTAIVGASFMATAAMAKPEVRVGGFFNFQVGMASQDVDGFGPSPGYSPVADERGYGFVTDSEIIVRASDKLDNGLAWSVKIELEANTDDGNNSTNGDVNATTADETTLTLSGAWGQVFFGNDDGPADTMKTGTKRAVGDAGARGVAGDFRGWVNWTTASTRVMSNANDIRNSSDSTKIAYITPRFAGFQLGTAFSPDRSDDGRYRDPDGNGSEENFWEFGANYDQKFGEVRLNLSAVASLADNENTLRNDTRSWAVGALVGFAGFKVGAGYSHNNDRGLARTATNGDTHGWDVGAGYNMGAWDFAVGYLRSEAGNINSTGEHVLQVASAGVTYDMGSGLSVYLEGIWFDVDSAANNASSFDNEGLAVITGIGVQF